MLETLNTDGGSGRRHRGQGGFTLIELLIVIVILAILAAIVVFAVGSTSKNAVAASCASDAKSVETAMAAYDAQMASYPANVAALTGTFSLPNGGGWAGPWLRAVPSTLHYNLLNDTNGHLYVVPPSYTLATIGAAASINGITAVVAPGGTWDFDSNSAVCGNYS